jgi:hypothetical protein
MSANLIVDLGNTAQTGVSINSTQQPSLASGALYISVASGAVVGNSLNFQNADTFCNLHVTGVPSFASGQLRIAVQTAGADTSGSYTDPTSGLATFPTSFQSGGILILNSGGLLGGVLGANVSGQFFYSGFGVFAGFQRPQAGQFVRAVALSGDFFAGALSVEFVSQYRTTGSGGGFSYAPGSGTVNV